MLVELRGKYLRPLSPSSERPFIGRITETSDVPREARAREILLVRQRPAEVPDGFRAYLFEEAPRSVGAEDAYVLAPQMRYLAHGDVVRLDPRRRFVNTLYRRSSPSNSLLVTERCDNFCVMCSQPPKERDDSWIVDELVSAIPLISPETRELGITGGEPALLGSRFIALLELLEHHLPTTAIHVLSNGRAFANMPFARAVGEVAHHDLMIGIPLYSALPEEHDFVVQARGAFRDTVRGIMNLKRSGVRVELRVVIHAETYRALPDLAEFIVRNLLFIDHVALMGLEPVGFARTNIDSLWVDPLDYHPELIGAVQTLARSGMNVSIYNHQLCVLPYGLRPFARKSISDWKNDYAGECEGCALMGECGGFFASASLRKSRGIRAARGAETSAHEV